MVENTHERVSGFLSQSKTFRVKPRIEKSKFLTMTHFIRRDFTPWNWANSLFVDLKETLLLLQSLRKRDRNTVPFCNHRQLVTVSPCLLQRVSALQNSFLKFAVAHARTHARRVQTRGRFCIHPFFAHWWHSSGESESALLMRLSGLRGRVGSFYFYTSTYALHVREIPLWGKLKLSRSARINSEEWWTKSGWSTSVYLHWTASQSFVIECGL